VEAEVTIPLPPAVSPFESIGPEAYMKLTTDEKIAYLRRSIEHQQAITAQFAARLAELSKQKL
jgi:hypothetical protein